METDCCLQSSATAGLDEICEPTSGLNEIREPPIDTMPFPCNLNDALTLGSSDYVFENFGERELNYHKVSPTAQKRARRLSDLKDGRHIGRVTLDEKALLLAVNHEDIDKVEQLLATGTDPSCHDTKLRTPLHFAASKGNESMVNLLLKHQADVNKRDTIGNTPLHLAACTGRIGVVTQLLKSGTDIKANDFNGRTPIRLARSRLRLLYTDTSYSSDRLKAEVQKVVDMMHAYLTQSQQHDDITELDSLCEKFSTASTRQEIDEFGGLLEKFTDLTVEKRRRGMT